MNNIDSNENIVTFVHILSSFNGKIIYIAKIYKQSYLHGINMKNPNRKNEEHGCTVEPPLRGHPDERSTPLERLHFWCKRGGLTRGVPLYLHFGIKIR